mgnify:CR=1 FL=1
MSPHRLPTLPPSVCHAAAAPCVGRCPLTHPCHNCSARCGSGGGSNRSPCPAHTPCHHGACCCKMAGNLGKSMSAWIWTQKTCFYVTPCLITKLSSHAKEWSDGSIPAEAPPSTPYRLPAICLSPPSPPASITLTPHTTRVCTYAQGL